MRINLTIGEAWMEAKYAPTGRASCKRCQNKIGKGELRLTNIEDEDHFHSEMHYHVDCFRLKPYFKEAKYTDVFYLDQLQQEDQELIEKQFSKLTKPIAQTKKQTKKKHSQSDSDFEVIQIQKVEKQYEPDYFCLYDDIQKDEFRKIEKELSDKSVAELKQMLKNNDQKQVGNKSELIQRIADCRVLGCLGKCPSCFAGRPKLDQAQRLFKCPGFMDDTQFKNCNKLWKPSELIRTHWKE